jgi:hypothetical protein
MLVGVMTMLRPARRKTGRVGIQNFWAMYTLAYQSADWRRTVATAGGAAPVTRRPSVIASNLDREQPMA